MLDPLSALTEPIGNMPVNDKTPEPVASARRRVRRYRMTGVIVLLLGLGSAGAVYWRGSHSADLADDPSMAGYYKAEARQMGMLYGKEGLLIEDLSNDLKQPGTQAFLIIAASIVGAAGCFYFAPQPGEDDETG
jgi:peptidoglycan/LPS O-acetylase OafA/YrhL